MEWKGLAWLQPRAVFPPYLLSAWGAGRQTALGKVRLGSKERTVKIRGHSSLCGNSVLGSFVA